MRSPLRGLRIRVNVNRQLRRRLYAFTASPLVPWQDVPKASGSMRQGSDTRSEIGCARTDIVFQPRIDTNSHESARDEIRVHSWLQTNARFTDCTRRSERHFLTG